MLRDLRERHETVWGCQAGTPTLLLPQERKNHLCKGIPNRALLYQTPPLSRVFILFSDAELPQKKFCGVLELQQAPWEGSSPHYNQGQATNRKFVRKSLSTRRKLPQHGNLGKEKMGKRVWHSVAKALSLLLKRKSLISHFFCDSLKNMSFSMSLKQMSWAAWDK